MRFKTDENLPLEAAQLLRGAGHDAITILDQQMSGDPDENVASACRREDRVLITLDLDFADLRTYPPESHPGVIVLRLRRQDKVHVLSVLGRLLSLFEEEQLAGQLWIVDEERLRIRGGRE